MICSPNYAQTLPYTANQPQQPVYGNNPNYPYTNTGVNPTYPNTGGTGYPPANGGGIDPTLLAQGGLMDELMGI
jgi:hypothetical protein